MKTTIWVMKTLLNEINGRLDITEENISELEIKTNYQKWNTRRDTEKYDTSKVVAPNRPHHFHTHALVKVSYATKPQINGPNNIL